MPGCWGDHAELLQQQSFPGGPRADVDALGLARHEESLGNQSAGQRLPRTVPGDARQAGPPDGIRSGQHRDPPPQLGQRQPPPGMRFSMQGWSAGQPGELLEGLGTGDDSPVPCGHRQAGCRTQGMAEALPDLLQAPRGRDGAAADVQHQQRAGLGTRPLPSRRIGQARFFLTGQNPQPGAGGTSHLRDHLFPIGRVPDHRSREGEQGRRAAEPDGGHRLGHGALHAGDSGLAHTTSAVDRLLQP